MADDLTPSSAERADVADVQRNISAYWSGHAAAYDEHPLSRLHMGTMRQAWLDALTAVLPPPAELLDVGTGTGQIALPLAELGYRVTGIDLAEGMLARARSKSAAMLNPAVLQLGDAVTPPFAPASFDAITARYVLWTLREPARALANWRRVLRPGGRLVVVDSAWYAGGMSREADSASVRDGFLNLYTPAVVAALPLAEADSINATATLIAETGFIDLQVTPLTEIHRLELALRPDPSIAVQMQYRVAARTP